MKAILEVPWFAFSFSCMCAKSVELFSYLTVKAQYHCNPTSQESDFKSFNCPHMVLALRSKPEEVTQNFLLKNKECKKLLYGESISICLNRARMVVAVLLTEHARNIEYSLPFKFLRLWKSNLK